MKKMNYYQRSLFKETLAKILEIKNKKSQSQIFQRQKKLKMNMKKSRNNKNKTKKRKQLKQMQRILLKRKSRKVIIRNKRMKISKSLKENS